MPRSLQIIFTALFATTFIIWFVLLSQVRVNADVAWLTQAAEHLLNGQSMVEYYFETNPPMSILIYIPVALMKQLGLQTWDALNIYVAVLTALSALASAYYLRKWDLSAPTIAIFVLGFLFSATFLSTYDYGQRDQIIGVILLPFVLGQLSITYNHRPHTLINIAVFVIGSIFILVKPHFGLIPTVLLFHRLYRTKSLRVILDGDFIILALSTITYIAVVLTYFPGFVSTILPVSLDVYAGTPLYVTSTSHAIGLAILSGLVCVFIAFSTLTSEQKHLFIALCVVSVLCLIPYAMQNKGFHYHLIPYLSFASLLMFSTAFFYVKEQKNGKFVKWFFGAVLVASLLVNVQIHDTNKHVSHDFLQDSPVAQRIAQIPEDGSFYVEYISTAVVIQISEYYDREYASRLPAIWTFPAPKLKETNKQKFDEYLNLTKDIIFEDFERYHPDVIFLLNDKKTLNILTAFEDTPEFREFFDNYVYEGTMQSKYLSYMFSMDEKVDFEYAVYARKDVPHE
ncbi:MAG: hypothetical protein JKY71_04120 [Alphaproteobacteria bacterium]|nr:hypothetical protein [Alphaproteobacteria bacterium]